MSSAYARTEIRTSLCCLLCARVAGTIQAGVVATDHLEHVRRLRCPYCGGRLWEQDAQPVLVLLPLPREELYDRRGRPPGPPRPRPPCVMCGLVAASRRSRFCGACRMKRWPRKAVTP